MLFHNDFSKTESVSYFTVSQGKFSWVPLAQGSIWSLT
jgi:hypothetical protein